MTIDDRALIQTHERISGLVHKTPVLTCTAIDRIAGALLFFKCENFQKTGSFKMRGASNAVAKLAADQATAGVATHSSGNFAQALALAARNRGLPARIVMPRTAPQIKKDAVAGYGAEIIECEPTLQAREENLAAVVAETGATFIHPYDNYDVIAGQATAAMELLAEIDKLDLLIAPVGGGGLISGTALAAHYFSPDTAVIAGEPAGADDAYRSLQEGKIIPSVNPQTIADGLLTSLGKRTFPIIHEHVQRIICVSEDEIVAAMKLIWQRMKLIVEPSAAVPLAALLREPDYVRGKRIGVILSGGNIDLRKLPFG